MTGNLEQTLERIRSKAEILTERYQKLLQEKQQADVTIEQLKIESQKQQNEISRLQQEVEHLKVVTTLTPKREDVEKSHAFLSKLVRDIDKCITELKE